MKKYKFSVFTPVYNREHTIDRVFKSLCSQTYRDFEWIVIDDGSTDAIKQKIENYIDNSTFPIHYEYQTNSGKHIAYNKAIELANGELFLTLDSDDEFLPSALEILVKTWESIPDEEKGGFSAVTGLCVDQNGNLVGTKYPTDIFDSNSIETHYKYKIKGEKSGFQVTSILKKYKFPNDNVGEYIGEGVIWNEISKKYKTRYINIVIRIYYIENKASIMQTANSEKSGNGKIFYYQYKLNNDITYFKYAPFYFFYYAYMYCKFSLIKNKKIKYQFYSLNNLKAKICFAFILPGTFILFKLKNVINLRIHSNLQ